MGAADMLAEEDRRPASSLEKLHSRVSAGLGREALDVVSEAAEKGRLLGPPLIMWGQKLAGFRKVSESHSCGEALACGQ